MLPKQPLRFVLADDPGAGKTIMAGLYIQELIMRADAHRVMIVAPGSLVEQWREELFQKFGLEFYIYSRELEATSPSGNAFDDHEHLIVRLDQLSRAEELHEKICATPWDLVVFDEAHKLSARYSGQKIDKTGRYKFAEKLGAATRHLLLMTATPHNGKEEEFQLFLALLDSDRFYGKFREKAHEVDTSDIMRRMIKEDLRKFDGKLLFPERHAYTVLLDSADDGDEPHLLFLLTHDIKSGHGQVISKRLQFVRVAPDGSACFAGWAPHLDLEPLDPADAPRIRPLLDAPWVRADLEQKALTLATSTLVPEHYDEVATRRIQHVDKTLSAVNQRLRKEIDFWTNRWMKLGEDQKAGKDVRLNLENARRTITDLEGRLEHRRRELQSMRHVASSTPVALGGAFVVPMGLLRKLRGEPTQANGFSADAAARQHVERIAMDAVRRVEEARGCRVVDVSSQKCGWDLTSYPPTVNGRQPDAVHIEVKGRVKGAATITVTRNEMLYALNQAEKFRLAIVLVGEEDAVEGPYYLKNPFPVEPGWGVSSVNFEIKALVERAERV